MHVFVFVCSCADKWKCGTSGRNMRVVEKRFSRVMMICLIQFGEPSYWLKAISYIVLERTGDGARTRDHEIKTFMRGGVRNHIHEHIRHENRRNIYGRG